MYNVTVHSAIDENVLVTIVPVGQSRDYGLRRIKEFQALDKKGLFVFELVLGTGVEDFRDHIIEAQETV